ncbi:MAG: Nramp family divalent metal transporter [Chthoniobacteraceae bacterium]
MTHSLPSGQPNDIEPTEIKPADAPTVAAAMDILSGDSQKGSLARLLPFLGPAFIACVAYIDPGNFATNIQAGAQFGYTLLWVVVASNLMALLVQALSAKLGIATGRNLAEHCRNEFPRPVVWLMWVMMEIVAMATDLAEFIGAAIGFNLLFGLPLFPSALLTAVITFLVLGAEVRGFRKTEAIIGVLVGVIAVSYLLETWFSPPDWAQVARHAFIPQLPKGSVLLATGILGATVMPHVIFLHSALTQNRITTRDPKRAMRLFQFELVDVGIAMGIAGLVNMAMLVMAATTFFKTGHTQVATLEDAHRTLEPLLGHASSWVFAIALLASGLSSASVGTMAGQVVMQGFMRRQIPIWLRRAVTMVPSLAVIAIGLEPTQTLVLSQVVLSFGLPFALVPLILFTRRKDLMGNLVNHPVTTAIAWGVAAVIIALNVWLLIQTFTDLFASHV